MLRMLKLGGRCAVIVPMESRLAHLKRTKSFARCWSKRTSLKAIIKLPSEYFGLCRSQYRDLALYQRGQTDNVFFFDVQADGKTLDDKRDKIGAEDDWQDLDKLREACRSG